MKLIHFSFLNSQLLASLETLTDLWSKAYRQRLPVWILLGLCLNLAIAPAVLATTNGTIERSTAYAIGLLGIVTLGLAIYLFAVIFQPERF
jgi:K+-transporting ATPase KdpF subunit